MADIDYPIVGQTYSERSPEFDPQLTVNYYVVYDATGDKPLGLFPTPGLLLVQTLNASDHPVRQIFSYKTYGLVFAGTQVYRLDRDFDVFSVGDIATNSGYVGVCNNNDQAFIVDGALGYCYDASTEVLTEISDVNLPSMPLDCVYFNGFFVACSKNSNRFGVSQPNDCTNWTYPILGGPNQAELSYQADTFQGMMVCNSRLFLFGNYITEVWYSVGGQDFPYARDDNMVFEYGCAATGSIAEGWGRGFWLASDDNGVGSVMMTDGSAPIPISNQAMDYAIRNYTRVDDAIGFVYKEDGHMFYELTFPTQDKTWLIDVTPNNGQVWCTNLERLGGSRHVVTCHTFMQGKHLVGSRLGPVVYDMSSSFQTNDGEDIQRTRIGPVFQRPNYNRFVVDQFEADFEGGVGKANDPGENPMVYLSVSYDKGHTFGVPMETEMGKIGQYSWRASWYGLGLMQVGAFVCRVDTYAPVRVTLTGANLRIRDCMN